MVWKKALLKEHQKRALHVTCSEERILTSVQGSVAQQIGKLLFWKYGTENQTRLLAYTISRYGKIQAWGRMQLPMYSRKEV